MRRGCLLAAVLLVSFGAAPALQGSAQQNDPAPAATHTEANAQDAAIPVLPAAEPDAAPASEQERITRLVRHRLLQQPEYSIWDWLAFRVNGTTVELLGDIYSGGLKDAAVNTVSRIDGVGSVIDHMKLLPASAADDRLRHQVADAIYDGGRLSQYAWTATRTIHVIVLGGQVRLEGMVDNQPDKDAATTITQSVAGVSQVTNHLSIDAD